MTVYTERAEGTKAVRAVRAGVVVGRRQDTRGRASQREEPRRCHKKNHRVTDSEVLTRAIVPFKLLPLRSPLFPICQAFHPLHPTARTVEAHFPCIHPDRQQSMMDDDYPLPVTSHSEPSQASLLSRVSELDRQSCKA